MFSTMPSTGTLTRRNMAMPRRASIKREILRRRDDDRALERHLLRHGELRVAGARRHVDHHDVERAPLDFAQHLRQRRHHHRPAPDHRRFFLDQKADRHHRHAVALDRLEPGAADGLRLLADGEQLRHRRAVDVGIENADLQPEIAQAEREIDRGGRFADAAFAGGDRDDRTRRRECRPATGRGARRPAPVPPRAAAGGACRGEPAAVAARLRPPARSAVSATMTELTPGTARIAASARSRTVSHCLTAPASTVIEKKHLAVAATISDSFPVAGSGAPSGPEILPSAARTSSFKAVMTGLHRPAYRAGQHAPRSRPG